MTIKLTKITAAMLVLFTAFSLFACDVKVDVDNSGDIGIDTELGIGGTVNNNGTSYGDGSGDTFTVEFRDHDGRSLSKTAVNKGSAATAPLNPTREGYVFVGWSVPFDNVLSNLIVEAQYVKLDYTNCEHSLSYISAQENTCTADGNIEYWYCGKCKTCFSDENSTVRIEKKQTVVKSTGHKKVVVDDAVPPTYESTGLTEGSHCDICKAVIVEQTKIPILGADDYSVTYINGSYEDGNGKISVCDFSLSSISWKYTSYSQSKGLILPIIEAAGYKFEGWYTEWDGGEKISAIAPNTTGHFVLYAHWSLETYEITYNLISNSINIDNPVPVDNIGNPNTASGKQTASVTVRDKTIPLDAPVRSKYDKFIGWYADAVFTTPVDAKWLDNWHKDPSDITVYAKWELAEYYKITTETDKALASAIQTDSSAVVIDFRSTPNGEFNIPSYSDSTLKSYFAVCSGVKDVYVLGNPDTDYKNTYICMATNTSDSKLTMHLDNFNYTGYIFQSEIKNAHLVIDVTGNSSVTSTDSVALKGFKYLTITGDGNLTVKGADGADATEKGTGGNPGYAAIDVTNLTVDMTGTLTAIGGSGGKGAIGTEGAEGLPGRKGDNVSPNRHGGDAENGGPGYDGGTGGKGGTGGDGACAVYAVNMRISEHGEIKLVGGSGGQGGKGGTGGDGGYGGTGGADNCQCIRCIGGNEPGNGGDGGNGGKGGTGGDGGYGAYAVNSSCNMYGSYSEINKVNGEGGEGGLGGDGGGAGGRGGGGDPGNSGDWGRPGDPGEKGGSGAAGYKPDTLKG